MAWESHDKCLYMTTYTVDRSYINRPNTRVKIETPLP